MTLTSKGNQDKRMFQRILEKKASPLQQVFPFPQSSSLSPSCAARQAHKSWEGPEWIEYIVFLSLFSLFNFCVVSSKTDFSQIL